MKVGYVRVSIFLHRCEIILEKEKRKKGNLNKDTN